MWECQYRIVFSSKLCPTFKRTFSGNQNAFLESLGNVFATPITRQSFNTIICVMFSHNYSLVYCLHYCNFTNFSEVEHLLSLF